MTQAAAAAIGERQANAPRTAKKAHQDARKLPLAKKLALKLRAAHRHRTTVDFFKTHRWLLHRSSDVRKKAWNVLRRSQRGLRKARKEVAYYRRLIRARNGKREARRLAAAPPRAAICGVFKRYCGQAISVAFCESRLSTGARNGQYLGLFQMGSSERRLFGHGETAHEQALAAHRYFVRSGRDWSPWSCRWAAS